MEMNDERLFGLMELAISGGTMMAVHSVVGEVVEMLTPPTAKPIVKFTRGVASWGISAALGSFTAKGVVSAMEIPYKLAKEYEKAFNPDSDNTDVEVVDVDFNDVVVE